MMPFILSGIVSTIGGALGNIFGGLFSTKQKRIEMIQTSILGAIEAVNKLGVVDSDERSQVLTAIQAEAQSDSWLAANWRPIFMYMCIGIIGSYWFFGYTPPFFNEPMSPMMAKVFDLVQMGLGGYMGARSIEKVMKMFFNNKLALKVMEKGLEKGAKALGVDVNDN